MQKFFYTALVAVIALSVLLPGSVSAAAKAKPVYSINYTSGTDGYSYFIGKNGTLINVSFKKKGKVTTTEITAVAPNGKTTKWSEKGSGEFDARYGINSKGKEVVYVYNAEKRKVTGLDTSLKKRWEYEFAKSDTYALTDRSQTDSTQDGSYPLNPNYKITIDGKKVKTKNVNPLVQQVGPYEYRVNEKNQTIQKKDRATGKVLWNKRAFDLQDKDGKTLEARSIYAASIDSEGNVFANAHYGKIDAQIVAVNSNGEVKWNKTGYMNDRKRVVGDILYYDYVDPRHVDLFSQSDYDIVVVNKYTGKQIRTYGPVSGLAPDFFVTIRGNNLYVAGDYLAEILNSKGKVIASYKSPKGRNISSYGFDNKNNFYIQSGYKPGTKGQNGWIFIYSDKGKLIGKKKFDQEHYDQFLIDPAGKHHYQMEIIDSVSRMKLNIYKYE